MMRTLSILLILSAAAPAAEKIVGGPFTVNVGPTCATVTWIVQTSEVQLGTSPDKLPQTAPVMRAERVVYAGLKPGTTYYYDVMGRDEGLGHFKTAPTGPASFRFVVYGDTRTRHDMHQRVINAVEKTDPDFVVHTGDLVSNGNDTGLWPYFFNIEANLLRKTAFFPSLGNHERNSPQYYDYFGVKTPYYSFDWGTTHITVLNSDIGNAGSSAAAKEAFWTEQTAWLEQDLKKAQKADFRFLVFHHPPFSAVKSRQDGNHEVKALVPAFEKLNVSAVFSGHDHNYQHHVKNGVHYVVTGGGGAPLYDVDAPAKGITQKVESIEHYVTVKVEGKRASIEAIALDGRTIDRIELQ